MMKMTGACLAASILASLLRRDVPELGLALAAAAVLTGAALLLRASSDIMELASEMVSLTGLSPAVFAPLLKVTAVALVSRIGAALCVDAGQSALARVMETAGAFCAMGCAVPLLRAVLELIRGWI